MAMLSVNGNGQNLPDVDGPLEFDRSPGVARCNLIAKYSDKSCVDPGESDGNGMGKPAPDVRAIRVEGPTAMSRAQLVIPVPAEPRTMPSLFPLPLGATRGLAAAGCREEPVRPLVV